MTTNITTMNAIRMLDMDTKGTITERTKSAVADEWLQGTVLGELYPNIQLALLTIPSDAVEWSEKAIVQDKMSSLTWEGTKYRMIGASGSAKNGKFYFSDEAHAPALKARFLEWPEAAITYLGIHTSDCAVVKTMRNAKVLIVPDLWFGTNDCAGWFSDAWVEELKLAPGHIYQTREAFDITVNGKLSGAQAKGLRKAMPNDVAALLGADLIIPESAMKPLPILAQFDETNLETRRFVSDVVIGVRETSRVLKFSSSYSILQHASRKVINEEIIPKAAAAIEILKDAWEAKHHLKVIEMIGKKMSIDDGQDETPQLQEDGYQAVESILLADGSGEITRHPYVHKTLSKLIAKWAYKLCTGGGLDLPGFTLAADGYLLAIDGKVVSGSNWLPLDTAIISDALVSQRGLCCRYPVRCAEDLLPMKHANLAATAALLVERGIAPESASWIAEHQLCLQGTYTLHQDTAKRNGGDFDGDNVCIVDGDRYPMFTDFRFGMTEHPPVKKIKAERLRSKWYNLESIAMGAMGNQIGVITNLISSCIACGLNELVYVLVVELQKEIDSLKHNTCADKSVLQGIREKAPKPAWLALKDPTSLTQLPMHLDVHASDRVGECYNVLRKRINVMMGQPMQVSQFSGLLVGNTPTQEMFDECSFIKKVHFLGHEMVRKRTDAEALRVKQANEALAGALKSKDEDAICAARKACKKATKSQELAIEWSKEKARSLGKIVSAWAMSKHTNRKAWSQAMHKLVHDSKSPLSTGSLGIHAFPQEFVDSMVERTGGIRSVVAPSKVYGEAVIENGNELWLYGAGRAKTLLLRYDSARKTLVR